ncbi:MAG: hypothetical protein JJE46_10895 [Acidimicrobiia bacterium]|nr:hypothetical protein [Acidimicrobiia bacterium]
MAVLVLMGLVTQGSDEHAARSETGPRLDTATNSGSVWYCAEGTSNPDGRADETIIVGNVGTTPTRARVTVFPGGDAARVAKQYRVAPGGVTRVRVADIATVAEPGVVVELRGGRAAVEHMVSRGQDRALGPCAREPAPVWRFAGGTTGKGAELWVALFNPFPDDAIVDLSAISGDGVRSPGALQGIVVPQYSRVSVPVHRDLPRVDLVALEVATRRGRVIAEQSLSLDGSDGRTGIAMTLGAGSAERWYFPMAVIGSGRSERLLVTNPGVRQAKVTVRFTLDATAIEPQTLIVPGVTTIAVDLSRVPTDVGFSMTVRSDRPIVAENVGASGAPQPATARGIASDLGLTVGAREWALLPSRLTATSADLAAVMSTDGRARRVEFLTVDRRGQHVVLKKRVARGARLVVDIAATVPDIDRMVLVRADGPIVVERESARPGITRSHAVRG